MGFYETWKANARYIRAVNSGNWSEMYSFFQFLAHLQGGYTRKRYIWNTLRGKEFYKSASHFVSQMAKKIVDGEYEFEAQAEYAMEEIETTIHNIVRTEKHERVLKSFIWQVTKQTPLLTMDTLPYMSYERAYNILTSEKKVLTDDALVPFIDCIKEKTSRIEILETMVDTMND